MVIVYGTELYASWGKAKYYCLKYNFGLYLTATKRINF
jgi:hypothetical protein